MVEKEITYPEFDGKSVTEHVLLEDHQKKRKNFKKGVKDQAVTFEVFQQVVDTLTTTQAKES